MPSRISAHKLVRSAYSGEFRDESNQKAAVELAVLEKNLRRGRRRNVHLPPRQDLSSPLIWCLKKNLRLTKNTDFLLRARTGNSPMRQTSRSKRKSLAAWSSSRWGAFWLGTTHQGFSRCGMVDVCGAPQTIDAFRCGRFGRLSGETQNPRG